MRRLPSPAPKTRQSQDSNRKGRYKFDALDWIAVFFVFATPLMAAYILICQ